ncbi:MAG TPA: CAP domain-containing protein [Candidatus Atopostipes pullistercoris]|uniref:CAP domain-containing protein n=1 Tax=Candidatus Atopostipes pullistercoris TaxID=2838467 RepID=A0A9D2FZS0_9LACT|nr:CAP domain-containing protein [Candidatus Atopostipes pullistercoris]
MKFLRKIISLILVFILGFWMAFAGILSGTKTGEVLETIVEYLPDRNTVNHIIEEPMQERRREINSVSQKTEESEEAKPTISTQNGEVNYEVIEAKVIELTNELRQEKGLSTLQPNDALRTGAYVRAVELEESFSHTRPDGSDAFTVFETENLSYPYKRAGENLAMGTYYLPEEEMAQFLFEGWVESEGHYENMVQQEYTEIGVGVHYDGEYLYLTQLFGTPLY